MKTIKIKFIGFWDPNIRCDNFLTGPLNEKYRFEISEEPEYIIASCFDEAYLDYDGIRIFYTGENICPDFNIHDYAIGFDDIDFGDRYFKYPLFCNREIYGKDIDAMLNKHLRVSELSKREFCSFVVSKGTGYVAPEREIFFRKLCEYKKVNSGGRFLNNIGEPNGVEDKLEFQKKHKFSIAFENSSHPGYCTEKIVQAFAAGTVPIYWGDPNVGEIFNDDAFVNVHKYKDFDEAIEAIKRIDRDDELYLKMLSTPALNDPEYIDKKNEELTQFLAHIFEQDVNDAYRRDRVGYSKHWEDDLKEFRRIRYSLPMRGKRKIKKIIGALKH